jgi:hypothetical protein
VDLREADEFFISSDNPADYDTLPQVFDIQGRLVEDPDVGGTMIYTLRFVSDVVPEPSSLILLALGFAAVYSCRRRSC